MPRRSIHCLLTCTFVIAFGAATAAAQQLTAGSAHSVLVKPDGTVWTSGSNFYGQLGDGTTTTRAVPVQVPGLTNVIAAAAGADHTLALKSDGTVWAWGQNFQGQLGDGTTSTRRTTPAVVPGLTNIVAVAAGASHSVALDANGVITAWGLNGNGQLGDGTTTRSLTPLTLATGWAATAIGAGQTHTLAVRSNGTLWAWGSNGSGQLGDGTTTERRLPIEVPGVAGAVAAAGGNCHSAVLRNDGRVLTTGCNQAGQLADGTTPSRQAMAVVPGLSGVQALAAGFTFTSALVTGGEVWSAGSNANGQLGDGTTTNMRSPVRAIVAGTVTRIAAGHNHALAVTSDATLYAWGANNSSQLGDGTAVQRTPPIALTDPNYVWKVATPAFSVAEGTYSTDRTVVITSATAAAEIHYTTNGADPTTADPLIASGGSVIVDRSLELKARAWRTGMPGSNLAAAVYTMQVARPGGSPSAGTFTTPQTVTLSTTTAGATLRYTTDGVTDPTETSPLYTTPLNVAATTTLKVVGFRPGWSQSPVLTATYRMNFGTLAAPTMTAGGTYTSGVTVTLAAMATATIRYTTNGSNVTTSSPVYTTPIEVTATTTIKAVAYHPDYATSPQSTASYTIVVATPTFSPDAGSYPAGQVVTVTSATPGAVLRFTLSGATPTASDPIVPSAGIIVGNFTLKVGAWKTGCTPSAIASAAYEAAGPTGPPRIAAGESHTLALPGNGAVWAWGLNSNGQLGDGTTTRRTVPVPVAALSGVVQAAGGGSHSVALRTDGTVLAWGYNFWGQLGNGTTSSSLQPAEITAAAGSSAVAAGRYYTLALRPDGTLSAWGFNGNGQLGDGTTTTRHVATQVAVDNVIAISAANASSFAVRNDGTLWSWGANGSGQLGTGNTIARSTPGEIAGLSNVTAVSTGGSHTLALLSDGTVRAWGSNVSGQLGDGTTTGRTLPVSVTGLSGVIAIAAGESHSVALTSAGAVWVWGNNAYGQLGDGTTTRSVIPKQVAGLAQVSGIAVGQQHTAAVGQDGSLWVWGRNNEGQLGDGTTANRYTPVTIAAAGMTWNVPTPALSVASGQYTVEQSVVVTNVDPQVVMHYTTTGADPLESDPIVASGAAVAVTQSLTLKVRGWKPGVASPSAIATGTYELRAVAPAFAPAGGTYSAVQNVALSTTTSGATIRYTTDGSAPNAGSPVYTAPVAVTTSLTLRAIASRANWTDSTASLAIYTLNFGTLSAPVITPGTGTYTSQVTVSMSGPEGATIRYTIDNSVPTSSSTAYSAPFVLKRTITVRAKAFKVDYTTSAEASAVFTIATPPPIISAASGAYVPGTHVTITHPDPGAVVRITTTGTDPVATDPAVTSGTSILIGDFTLKARAFKVGCVESAAVASTYALTAPISAGVLAAGGDSTAVATPGGRLFTWGNNASGQLGDGTTTDRLLPVSVQTLTGVRSLAMGLSHSVASTADGRLYGWGTNSGDGTSNARTLPREVAELPGIVAVAAGSNHSLALRSGGVVYAWGTNTGGQLGNGSTTPQYIPLNVPGLAHVVAVAAGGSHSLAITENGNLYAWGANSWGQLGDGTTDSRLTPTLITSLANVVEIAAGAQHSLARLANGEVYAWGQGLFGQLGAGTSTGSTTPQRVPNLTVRMIAAGASHSLALRSDGVLLAWGSNGSGQLGNGTTTGSNTPVAVAAPAMISAIAAGRNHSAAITAAGDVWTWGAGGDGQLGSGSTADRSTPQAAFAAGGQWAGTSAPTLSIPAGTYSTEQTVVVSSTAPDVVIRYTTNGSDPTDTDAVVPTTGEVVVDRSLTLKARAWPLGGAPSAVASAAYTMRPSTPQIAPSSGTYVGAQLVTMQTITSGATIRYTLDGTTPTDSSTAYAEPFAVTASTTVQARAFRTGWAPSHLATSVLIVTGGILESPIATPPGGSYGTPQSVTLSGPAGAAIRYTIDGSDPTATSPLYTGPLTIGAGSTTLKARAFLSGWSPSNPLVETYNIAMATLVVQTFVADVESPQTQVPAGEGVYIRIDGRPVGQTLADGTLTVEAPPGTHVVTAIIPSTLAGQATVTLAESGTDTVSILLDQEEVADRTDLVLVEAPEGIVPMNTPSFTLKFMRDGAIVPMSLIYEVDVLDHHSGNLLYTLADLFTIAPDGAIVALEPGSVFGSMDGMGSREIRMRVAAQDTDGFTHMNIVRFRVGQFRLVLDVAAPPSNPGVSVSNLPVDITIVGSNFTFRRVTDGDGRIDIASLPYSTLKFEAVTTQGGRYYYGQGIMFHNWHRSATLVMRNVTDVVNGVASLIVGPDLPGNLAAGMQVRPDAAEAPDPGRAARAALLVPRASARFASAPDVDPTVTIDVTSADPNLPVSRTATLVVPQGTEKVTLKYDILSYEYPEYVLSGSVFDDLWSVTVFAGPNGQQLFHTMRNVNSQAASAPVWQMNSATGRIEEELDVAALTTEGSVELTLHGTAVNIRDGLFSTTVSAQLGGPPEFTISDTTSVDIPANAVPGDATNYSTDSDSSYYSIPRTGERNVYERWYKLVMKKAQETTIEKVRVMIHSGAGGLLQPGPVLDVQLPNENVELVNGGKEIKVRVSMHANASNVPSTPPTTHDFKYKFYVEGKWQGQTQKDDKESGARHALWRMPDGFPRYNPVSGNRDTGFDDWARKSTYEYMDQNRFLIPRVDDISGEHARDIGHRDHEDGRDIDVFHVYVIAGTQLVGWMQHDALKARVFAALRGDAAALSIVTNWVNDTRAFFQAYLDPGVVEKIYYADGNAENRGTGSNLIELPDGWAETLMETGKLTASGKTLDTTKGNWDYANDSRITYRDDHNSHIHLRLVAR